MLVTSWDENADKEDLGQDTQALEDDRQRKGSLLWRFVDAILFDEEIDHSQSKTESEKSIQGDSKKGGTETQMALTLRDGPQSGDTREQMVVGLQKLDRDRKKSLLVRVIEGILSRSDHSQRDLSTESIKEHATVDVANHGYATGDIQREGNRDNKSGVDLATGQLEIDQEGKPTSVSANCRQRRSGIVLITNHGQLGLPNFGFEHERSEQIEEECSSHTSGYRRQFPVQPLMNEDGGKDLQLDTSVEKPPNVEDRSQEKDIQCVEDGRNPSASEDKQEVLGLPGSSTIHQAKKRRPKTIKYWLRDPHLYKVCLNRV